MEPFKMDVLSRTVFTDKDSGNCFSVEVTVIRVGASELLEFMECQSELRGWNPETYSLTAAQYWKRTDDARKKLKKWKDQVSEKLGYSWHDPENQDDVEQNTEGLCITQSMADIFTVIHTAKI